MSKIKYQATDSRGQVHKRSTTHRIYSHAVVAHIGPSHWHGRDYPARSVAEWAGRLDLAQNVARRWERDQAVRNASPERIKDWGAIEGVEILIAQQVSK